MGYHRAGFDVTGVDIEPQPRYPFAFVQAEALEYLAAHGHEYDAIHASPPCQGYVSAAFRVTPSGQALKAHPRLISEVREALMGVGRPWVIENVQTAIGAMRRPIRVCGTSFGLPLRRHRLFEASVPLMRLACRHEQFTDARYPTQWRPKGRAVPLASTVQVYGNGKGAAQHWPAAMGIDWMTHHELTQAIPPAYTEFIGRQLLNALAWRAA